MKTEELSFEKYLYQLGLSQGSVKTYLYQVTTYLTAYPDAEHFGHKAVMDALEEIAKLRPNTNYRTTILACIKRYYDYLLIVGRRDGHPCRNFAIRNLSSKKVIHDDLFSSEELELLMDRKDRYPHLKVKNQVVISLMIYQALTSSEIMTMKVSHVDLDEGKIFVKESRALSRRHLEMNPKQYKIFDKYINESRNILLKGESDKLIIGMRGHGSTTAEASYIVEQFKPLFPGRALNPSTIRQSVIANWLNERKYPTEMVQLMAGHKTMSTTALYRHTANDEKRILINKFHPLG